MSLTAEYQIGIEELREALGHVADHVRQLEESTLIPAIRAAVERTMVAIEADRKQLETASENRIVIEHLMEITRRADNCELLTAVALVREYLEDEMAGYQEASTATEAGRAAMLEKLEEKK